MSPFFPLSPRKSRAAEAADLAERRNFLLLLAGAPAAAMAAGPTPVGAASPLGSQLEEVERAAIVRALEQTRYNKTAAAKLLGMTFRALRYRIKKLGIE